MKVYAVKADLTDDVAQYLLQFVSAEKKERIKKQKIRQSAVNMIIGELLAKAAIKEVFGISVSAFCVDENGKPYIDEDGVWFNISHSGEYVACVVSDVPCGIDIQKIKEYNPRLARKVCSDEEIAIIGNGDSASEFTRLWTEKEAVVKMLGTGISGADLKMCNKEYDISSERIEDYWVSVV